MPSELVELLKPWVATLGPEELLWPNKWAAQKRGSKFVQHDLANARNQWLGEAQNAAERETRDKSDFLSYHDAEGRQADFHALRHACLTRLGRAGVSAKAMQKLARHSTVELTLGRYTHADLYDLADVVEKLPRLDIDNTPQNGSAVLRATGTDEREVRETVSRPTVLKLNDASSGGGRMSYRFAYRKKPPSNAASFPSVHPQNRTAKKRRHVAERENIGETRQILVAPTSNT